MEKLERNFTVIKYLTAIFILTICTTVSFAQYNNVYYLQDKRDANALIEMLGIQSDNVTEKILIGIANTGDTTHTDAVIHFLETNPSLNLRAVSMFTLGQLGGADALVFLKSQLLNKQDATVLKQILLSLGRLGDEEALGLILGSNFTDDESIEAALYAVGLMGARNIKALATPEFIQGILSSNNSSSIERAAAYALLRTGDKFILDNARAILLQLVKSIDPVTRMWAYSSLGRIPDKEILELLIANYYDEFDWRIQVNILNAIGNYSIGNADELTDNILSVSKSAIENENEHISLTGLRLLGKIAANISSSENETLKLRKSQIIKTLRDITGDESASANKRIEAANSYSQIAGAESYDFLITDFQRTNNYRVKAGILRAVGRYSNASIFDEVRALISEEVSRYNELNPNTTGELIPTEDLAILYRGFVDMLATISANSEDEDLLNLVRLIFSEFASSQDEYIVAVCLGQLAGEKFEQYKDETAQIMTFDIRELDPLKDKIVLLTFIYYFGEIGSQNGVEVLQTFLNINDKEIAEATSNALNKINPGSVTFDATKFPYIEKNLSIAFSYSTAEIETNKGNFTISFFPEIAPFTVINFIELVQKGYYDGVRFHRVVPNFVIQTGDPKGNGYGGPGYSIRSEFSPLHYDEGFVGMASSGKDTEGSQFFITHSPQPHLDGRYSIFAKVISGMDIVNSIYLDDFIISIKLN